MMNLLEIKRRFARFVHSFDPKDVALLLQYMELALSEYNQDPGRFLCKFRISA